MAVQKGYSQGIDTAVEVLQQGPLQLLIHFWRPIYRGSLSHSLA